MQLQMKVWFLTSSPLTYTHQREEARWPPAANEQIGLCLVGPSPAHQEIAQPTTR